MMRKIERVYVHCSASGFGTLEWIRSIHQKERGWTDIGYHYLITNGIAKKGDPYNEKEDGRVYRGRGENRVGAHVLGDNTKSLGVCLIGTDTFTPKQMSSLAVLIHDLCKRHGILPGPDTVLGHREYWDRRKEPREKECPGFDLVALRQNLMTVT
jgi:hypothetical protein